MLVTLTATRLGTFALITPVMTSTDGRCVAIIKWIPTARALWAMRQMLVAAAALYWKLPEDQCSAKGGLVSNTKNDETLSYGNLAELAGRLAIPAETDIKLKTPKEWRYIREEIPSLTVPRIVKGDSTFGIDVKRPGMVYAVVARPPQLFGRVGSFDDTNALAVPGVLSTMRLPDAKPPALFQPLGGVAVVARDTWAAIEGRRALAIAWRDGPNAGYEAVQWLAEVLPLTHFLRIVRGTLLKGSEHNDKFENQGGQIRTTTNHSGGIQGGISNGMDIYFRVAFKPVATIMHDQESVNEAGEATTVQGKGRHDPCVVPRAVPIVEAMAALVLADFYLLNKIYQ